MTSHGSPFEHPVAPLLFLLVIDCETRRYTREGPVDGYNVRFLDRESRKKPTELDDWFFEVRQSVTSGRRILCIPAIDPDFEAISRLGLSLGYEEWPSKTILSPVCLNVSQINNRYARSLDSMWATLERYLTRELRQVRREWLKGLRATIERPSIDPTDKESARII